MYHQASRTNLKTRVREVARRLKLPVASAFKLVRKIQIQVTPGA